MSRLRFAVVFIVLCVALALLAMGMTYKTVDARLISADMKLMIEKGGHGSATHIGNGSLISAAHVVPEGVREMKVKLEDGTERVATVLWVNRNFDVAHLAIQSFGGISAANLACRAPKVGELVTSHGNPINLERITTWGRVSGLPVKVGNAWARAVPINIAMAGGMSGGGLYSANGDLIGVNVGVMVQPLGFAGTFVGLAYVVPGDTVCTLLARA